MAEEIVKDGRTYDMSSASLFPYSEVASATHTSKDNISFVNPVGSDTAHFWFGYTQQADGRQGFFKLVKDSEENMRLQREFQAMQIARQIGIPTVELLNPYQETEQKRGILHVAKLNTDNGTLLKTDTDVQAADPQLGIRAAHALFAAEGKRIPHGCDSSLLERDDWRFYDEQTFWSIWEQISHDVLANPHTDKITDSNVLRKVFLDTRRVATPLINNARAITHNPPEYFIHRDINLKNMFFPHDEQAPVLFLDFEDAGASTNPALAQITDIGNFYARSAYNPELQQLFVKTYAQNAAKSGQTDQQTLLKTSMVFGSLFLAPWIYKEGHLELPLEEKLLSNLANNLNI